VVLCSLASVPDADPAFQVNPDPVLDPIRIQGFEEDKNLEKYSWKKMLYYFVQKLQFTIGTYP
jgi:hypothetical protein